MRRVALVFFMGASTVMAETMPPGGKDLFDSKKAMSALPASCSSRSDVEARGLDIRHDEVRHAIQIKTVKRPEKDYHLQFRVPIEQPVSKGEAVLLSFWARGVEGTDREAVEVGHFEEVGKPTLHLARGLVRKGHRHDPVRRDIHATYQIGDTVGQNTGFP